MVAARRHRPLPRWRPETSGTRFPQSGISERSGRGGRPGSRSAARAGGCSRAPRGGAGRGGGGAAAAPVTSAGRWQQWGRKSYFPAPESSPAAAPGSPHLPARVARGRSRRACPGGRSHPTPLSASSGGGHVFPRETRGCVPGAAGAAQRWRSKRRVLSGSEGRRGPRDSGGGGRTEPWRPMSRPGVGEAPRGAWMLAPKGEEGEVRSRG